MKFTDQICLRILLMVAKFFATDDAMKTEIGYISNAVQCRYHDEERRRGDDRTVFRAASH